MQKREQILRGLESFANQRPGLEPGNYGSGRDGFRAYRAESREITKDLHDVRQLLSHLSWRESVTAEHLEQSARSSYSGRLSLKFDDENGLRVDYCTGQYFPTEYRRAVCAVLAGAIWSATREDMENGDVKGESPGTRIRDAFRREFGLRIARRWFDYGS